jgi:hypothetical protein
MTEPAAHSPAAPEAAGAAELQKLIREQQADDTPYVSPPSGSFSLDAPILDEGDNPSTIGEGWVGIDPTDQWIDAMDTGSSVLDDYDADQRDAPIVAPRGIGRMDPWHKPTIVARTHPFRGVEQFDQAYGTKWRTGMRVAPILVTLFECITTAVGVSAATEAAGKRGKPTPHDTRVRMLMALAVQAFRAMDYPPSAIARTLSLTPSAVTRYSNPELLPVLSPEAFERIFGPTATSSDGFLQSPAETDAARGRSDDRPPRPPRRATQASRTTTRTPGITRSSS